MRYFLITFSIVGKNSVGSINFPFKGFPSHLSIEEAVTREIKYPVKVVVQNIFEFKDESDYKAYTGEDEIFK